MIFVTVSLHLIQAKELKERLSQSPFPFQIRFHEIYVRFMKIDINRVYPLPVQDPNNFKMLSKADR